MNGHTREYGASRQPVHTYHRCGTTCMAVCLYVYVHTAPCNALWETPMMKRPSKRDMIHIVIDRACMSAVSPPRDKRTQQCHACMRTCHLAIYYKSVSLA
jgi:hypothetical protein